MEWNEVKTWFFLYPCKMGVIKIVTTIFYYSMYLNASAVWQLIQMQHKHISFYATLIHFVSTSINVITTFLTVNLCFKLHGRKREPVCISFGLNYFIFSYTWMYFCHIWQSLLLISSTLKRILYTNFQAIFIFILIKKHLEYFQI